MRTHLAVSFRSQRSDAMEDYVISLIGKNEIQISQRKERKGWRNVLHTIHNSVIF